MNVIINLLLLLLDIGIISYMRLDYEFENEYEEEKKNV